MQIKILIRGLFFICKRTTFTFDTYTNPYSYESRRPRLMRRCCYLYWSKRCRCFFHRWRRGWINCLAIAPVRVPDTQRLQRACGNLIKCKFVRKIPHLISSEVMEATRDPCPVVADLQAGIMPHTNRRYNSRYLKWAIVCLKGVRLFLWYTEPATLKKNVPRPRQSYRWISMNVTISRHVIAKGLLFLSFPFKRKAVQLWRVK